MYLNSSIFREYDIRGVVGKDLTPEFARLLGRGVGAYLAERLGARRPLRVSVGRDVRTSSGMLKGALVEGLCSTGLEVVDIGECPTPLQYFSLHRLDLDGGVMITGSHNPPEFNGFKVSVGKQTLHGEAIQAIRRIMERGDFPAGEGKETSYAVIPAYLEEVAGRFRETPRPDRPVRIVADAGNGTAGLVAPELLKRIGCGVIPLYCEIDGTFPHHHPDPTVVENLHDLIRTVREEGADLGVAYDGDGDRIGVVDETGRILWGDQLLLLFGREILRERPGAVIVGEVKCSQFLYDDLRARGGDPVMWKAGHSLIKEKMRETGAAMGGEMSGHLFFADRYYGYDDAFYATCRLVEILWRRRVPVSRLLEGVPLLVSTPEIRVECPDAEKFRVVDRLRERIRARQAVGEIPLRDLVTIDGVRVVFEKGWGLVRASNTQPALVLRFEAESEGLLAAYRGALESELEAVRVESKA